MNFARFFTAIASPVALGAFLLSATIPGPTRSQTAIAEVAQTATGLQKPWPKMVVPADNPSSPAKVALGKLLFFDPVLSNNNSISCAHCHHPDLGFSDGLPRALGYGADGVGRNRSGGVLLPRHTPTLWNTGYSSRQYWDGRAESLEAQCRIPITEQDEMKQDAETLAFELHHIPEYEALFDRVFGGAKGSAISLDNVARAIAAFQRTLVTRNSRFDRYSAGAESALNSSEKRGLKLFLSTKTRCAECHGLPTFANADFKVIGVPDVAGLPPDPFKKGAATGRGGGLNGAYKIPTLRNVALRSPYMHNGSLKTLAQVLDFYSKGGGRGRGLTVSLQDDKIRKYPLSPAEKADLTAFLGSLTDVSAMPSLPKEVPSGLPVVPRIKRSTTEGSTTSAVKRAANADFGAKSKIQNPKSKILDVRPGGSIQSAVDEVGRNGKVRVYPGVYRESLLSIHHGVTLEGVVSGSSRPVLEGNNQTSDAVIALGDGFTISGFEIRNFQGNGVLIRGAKNATMRDLVVSSPGDYGLYPVECDGVTVERCNVSGAKDAGIYVGQSRRIVVRGNEASKNVAGIEIENSTDARVEDNYLHDNTGGILVFVLPFNVSKVASNCVVVRNRVVNNNTPNFAAPGAIVANVLQGTGIMVLAADRTEITQNEIIGNGSFGVAVVGLGMVYPKGTNYDVDPVSDDTWVHGNRMEGNGAKPDPRLEAYKIPPRDLLWDYSGRRNKWDQPGATTYPARLPASPSN